MIGKILCRLGRHRRSSSRSFRGSEGQMKSRCSRCDVPMTRDHETGLWAPVEATAPDPIETGAQIAPAQ